MSRMNRRPDARIIQRTPPIWDPWADPVFCPNDPPCDWPWCSPDRVPFASPDVV